MKATTDPEKDSFVKDASPFTFEFPQPSNGGCDEYYIVGNAALYTCGRCDIHIDRIVLNRRKVDVDLELQKAINGACEHYVSTRTFRRHTITNFKFD